MGIDLLVAPHYISTLYLYPPVYLVCKDAGLLDRWQGGCWSSSPPHRRQATDRVPVNTIAFIYSVGVDRRYHRITKLRSRTEIAGYILGPTEPNPKHLRDQHSFYTCITIAKCYSDLPRPGMGPYPAGDHYSPLPLPVQKWKQSGKHPETTGTDSHKDQWIGRRYRILFLSRAADKWWHLHEQRAYCQDACNEQPDGYYSDTRNSTSTIKRVPRGCSRAHWSEDY